jgi:uncharacterized protein (TIGR02996 family)
MTSHGEALFRAVCENPADDTPRLAYADWLDDHGDATRAEFIRLQCEASHLCPAYSTPTAARNRASQLLKEFGDRWYDELPEIPGVEWGGMFVRGFIDRAQTHALDEVTATLAAAFAATPLRYLTVSSLRPGQLRELLAFPLLSRLVNLHLPGTQGREEARLLTEGRLRFPHVEID